MLKVCANCLTSFETQWVNPATGKKHTLQRRQFCLTCSPFGQHNTKARLTSQVPESKQCTKCRETKKLEDFYPRKSNSVEKQSWCKLCQNEDAKFRMKEIKRQAVAYLGGKCLKCGYSKYDEAFDFHHRDPSQKDFTISRRKRVLKSIVSELDKCDLLCCRCHREVHVELGLEAPVVDSVL